jgi:DNA-binding NtrC family response regulator
MYTCHADMATVKASFASGVIDYLEKDMDPEKLAEKVRTLCEKWEQTAKPIRESADLDEREKVIRSAGFVGKSRSLYELVLKIRRYAPENQTLLIQGETGTGKELVAAALHELSERKGRPFIAVNCSAITETLQESELFGHTKGAFTGATQSRVGRFAAANHGTLFLDEVGDLPASMQVKLLRVLQERVIEQVGSQTPIEIDVRVVAASHKDLKDLVERGLFREDLYYRLNDLTLQVDPLRERPDDIEPLIAHFTKLYCEKRGVEKSFQRATLSVFKNYSWPGNIRQLKSMIEQHLIDCTERSIKVEHLNSELFQANLKPTLKELEKRKREEVREYITEVLARSDRKSDAARTLGLSPSLLNYHIKTYEVAE